MPFRHHYWGDFLHLEQFVKKDVVIRYGYPQILDVGVTALRTHRDGLRSSVIVYNCGVIDGNVGGTALKISHRVTTL